MSQHNATRQAHVRYSENSEAVYMNNILNALGYTELALRFPLATIVEGTGRCKCRW
jgi:hypothetical protein